MFARQAMILLEFAARLCKGDASGQALRDLSVELDKIDPKNFTPVGDRPSILDTQCIRTAMW